MKTREDRKLHVVCKMNIHTGFVATVFEGYGQRAYVKAYALINGRTKPDAYGNYYVYTKIVE